MKISKNFKKAQKLVKEDEKLIRCENCGNLHCCRYKSFETCKGRGFVFSFHDYLDALKEKYNLIVNGWV